MFVGREFANRLAAKGAEAHQHPEWVGGIRNLSSTVQRVPTVTLHMADLFQNKAIPVSHVSLPRKRLALEECIKISAHELVAGRGAGSMKCKRCWQVCGRKNPAHAVAYC